MALKTYQLVFSGEVVSDYDVDTVKRNLAGLFKADMSIIDRLFSGQPVVIKRNLNPENALVYLSAITRAGGVARMEITPKSREMDIAMERRKIKRRLLAKRRKHMRDMNFVPDRRGIRGRRDTDKPSS